jgi:hypothetical protein|tara:strand:- start:326 stop:604 length:279 start_codon:yes stop_codon:yes gene_type:complete
MNTKSVWSNERKEIATWLSGYLAMVKKWVDKILDNDDVEVDKNKIIKQLDEWIQWLEETKLKIMKMRDVDPKEMRDIALEWHRKRNNLKERE